MHYLEDSLVWVIYRIYGEITNMYDSCMSDKRLDSVLVDFKCQDLDIVIFPP